MTGAARPRRSYRYLAVIAVVATVFAGFIALWMPGAGAQDGTGVEGTAVAPFTPTPAPPSSVTPTPVPISYQAPIFLDGSFRIVVQRAEWAHEIPELGLNPRSGRDWIAVVADVINFSANPANLTPDQFTIRTNGNPLGGFARQTTQDVAARMGLQPSDPSQQMTLQPNNSVRLMLVFQVDTGVREPGLVYQYNAVPLATLFAQSLGFSNLPSLAQAPTLVNATVSGITSATTVQVTGDATGDQVMAGVDPPTGAQCYANEAKNVLSPVIGTPVMIEQPTGGQRGVLLWFPHADGTRELINQSLVILGYSASDTDPGNAFAPWMSDSQQVAQLRRAGLWGACTNQHGVSRPSTVERATLETAIDGQITAPYTPWVEWSPLIKALPGGGAIAFYSAEAQSADPSTPTPSETLQRKIYYSTYDPATATWSVGMPLPNGGALQFGVAGVVDSRGRVHIVYSDRKADSPAAVSVLKYMVRDTNGTWSQPQDVAPSAQAGHQLSPAIAIDSNDNLYVVWQDQRDFSEQARRDSPSNADIYAAEKPAGGVWSAALPVNKHTENELASRPLIAVDGNRVVALWSIYDTRMGTAAAARIDWSQRTIGEDGLTWPKAATMIAGRGEAFGGRLLDLKADPTGGLIFVYARQSTDTFLFMERLPANSDTWSSDILITYGNRGTFPSLTVARDGTAYIVYNIGTGDRVDVGAVAVAPNSISPGPEVILTSDQPGAHGRPVATTDITALPWVIFYSQPEGGTPNAVETMRNFIVPRSNDELQAIIEAGQTPTPTSAPSPTATAAP